MKSAKTSANELVLIFDAGDKFKRRLLEFANQNNVATCRFFAIGAFAQARIAYFNIDTKSYEETEIKEQVEVASLIGNIAFTGGERKIHAHVVVGRSDGSAHAGHLVDAVVQPTLELFMTTFDDALVRKEDDATGLPLIALD